MHNIIQTTFCFNDSPTNKNKKLVFLLTFEEILNQTVSTTRK